MPLLYQHKCRTGIYDKMTQKREELNVSVESDTDEDNMCNSFAFYF